MKKFMTMCAVGLALAVSSVASADSVFDSSSADALRWQTAPVLGTSVDAATGNVVVQTTLGVITIPSVEIGDPPDTGVSMTDFWTNPVLAGGHYYDPNAFVASGSGIYLDPAATYTYTASWSFFGNGYTSPYNYTDTNTSFSEASGFIMLMSGFGGGLPAPVMDVGRWNYTETWTDNNPNNGGYITASRDFVVHDLAAVPLPASVGVGFSMLAGFGAMFAFRKRLSRRPRIA